MQNNQPPCGPGGPGPPIYYTPAPPNHQAQYIAYPQGPPQDQGYFAPYNSVPPQSQAPPPPSNLAAAPQYGFTPQAPQFYNPQPGYGQDQNYHALLGHNAPQNFNAPPSHGASQNYTAPQNYHTLQNHNAAQNFNAPQYYNATQNYNAPQNCISAPSDGSQPSYNNAPNYGQQQGYGLQRLTPPGPQSSYTVSGSDQHAELVVASHSDDSRLNSPSLDTAAASTMSATEPVGSVGSEDGPTLAGAPSPPASEFVEPGGHEDGISVSDGSMSETQQSQQDSYYLRRFRDFGRFLDPRNPYCFLEGDFGYEEHIERIPCFICANHFSGIGRAGGHCEVKNCPYNHNVSVEMLDEYAESCPDFWYHMIASINRRAWHSRQGNGRYAKIRISQMKIT
ncbi:Rho1 guanine nucleotide exchange factor 1 [Lasiodiplodia theobromae]|uniref:Rho1 guanine nucleotide exchange factor 1 n=1 Tax=Lasiodiplodia theobromae TaxID=45133 RepID=UPI0015C3BC32|nr:Rho1 guanine nucleotide exchange factor 1 [Lasiodiplodia theobromae]KAF4542502.1 Rho1 guanine nucleotide exchange factor 1 [Lasiodiplodia theobromae]